MKKQSIFLLAATLLLALVFTHCDNKSPQQEASKTAVEEPPGPGAGTVTVYAVRVVKTTTGDDEAITLTCPEETPQNQCWSAVGSGASGYISFCAVNSSTTSQNVTYTVNGNITFPAVSVSPGTDTAFATQKIAIPDVVNSVSFNGTSLQQCPGGN